MTLRRGMILVALAVSMAFAGIVVFKWQQNEADELWPCGEIPDEVAQTVQDLTDFEDDVLAIAHSSDGSVEDAQRALDCGADGIEIDVVAFEGELLAAHGAASAADGNPPLLDRIWSVAVNGQAIELNMKSTSPEALERIFQFLDDRARPGGPRLAVSTPDVDALRAFQERAPDVERYLSIEYEDELRRFRQETALQEMLHGVSVHESLLDSDTMAWFGDTNLQLWAWTVNDPFRAHELAQGGVDGITSDNPALFTAFRD